VGHEEVRRRPVVGLGGLGLPCPGVVPPSLPAELDKTPSSSLVIPVEDGTGGRSRYCSRFRVVSRRCRVLRREETEEPRGLGSLLVPWSLCSATMAFTRRRASIPRVRSSAEELSGLIRVVAAFVVAFDLGAWTEGRER
jgi:hypothetical protein